MSIPHQHGGTDAPECTPYGVRCDPLAEVRAILKEANACADCGFEVDSFACRIRHIHINTGWAKASND